MNNLSKEIVSEEGNKETIVASSTDNYNVKIDKHYILSNHEVKKENPLVKKFKGSILGSDIGIKNSGFSSIAALALVIALTVIFVMYLMWRF